VTTPAHWRNLWNASPPSIFDVGITYDKDRKVMVVFGGATSSGPQLADTWEWDGARAEWKKRVPLGAAPPGRFGGAFVYDPIQKTSMLWSGAGGTGFVTDQWDWAGGTATWTARTITGARPSGRVLPSSAWDSDRRRVVVFGGGSSLPNPSFSQTNDLWEWDGATQTWTDRTPSGLKPTPRYGASTAYDSVRKKLVIYGGNNLLDQTWEWDGATQTWTQGPSVGLRIDNEGSGSNNTYNLVGLERMVFDESRAKIVLPVYEVFSDPGNRFFEYEPTPAPAKWVEIMPSGTVPPYTGEAAYDPDRKVVFYFSGGRPFEYDGVAQQWTERLPRGPVKRSVVSAVVDGYAGALMMFGGTSGNVTYQDLWEWTDADPSWNEQPAGDPKPPCSGAMVYDSKRDRTVLLRGHLNSDGPNAPLDDAWLWTATAGAWTRVTASGTMPLRGNPVGAAYDAVRDKIIFLPGFSSSDVWELDAGTFAWSSRPNAVATLSAALTGRVGYGVAYDSDRDKVLLVYGYHIVDPVKLTIQYDTSIWEWDVATNTYAERKPLPAGPFPSTRANPGVSYDSARHVLVMIGPTDSWEWDPLSGVWVETTSPEQPANLRQWMWNWDVGSQFFDAKNARTLVPLDRDSNSPPYTLQALWEYRSSAMPPAVDGGDAAINDGGLDGGGPASDAGGAAGTTGGTNQDAGGAAGTTGGTNQDAGGGQGGSGGASGVGGAAGAGGGAFNDAGGAGGRSISDGAADGARDGQGSSGCGCRIGDGLPSSGLLPLVLVLAITLARRGTCRNRQPVLNAERPSRAPRSAFAGREARGGSGPIRGRSLAPQIARGRG
jgi:hypothetical protein